MPSSISNFKKRLRLPRLFFRQPSREEQIHGGPPLEFERPIPPAPWRGIAVVISIVVIATTTAWELHCRSVGYGPTLNDNEDLWTMARRRVQPESIVVIGDSRAWFDVDLDEFQKGLGKRPIQLAMAGSTAGPVLDDLASDKSFHGTIICSFVPGLFFAPPGSPPMERAEKLAGPGHRDDLESPTDSTGPRGLNRPASKTRHALRGRCRDIRSLAERASGCDIASHPFLLAPLAENPAARKTNRERSCK